MPFLKYQLHGMALIFSRFFRPGAVSAAIRTLAPSHPAAIQRSILGRTIPRQSTRCMLVGMQTQETQTHRLVVTDTLTQGEAESNLRVRNETTALRRNIRGRKRVHELRAQVERRLSHCERASTNGPRISRNTAAWSQSRHRAKERLQPRRLYRHCTSGHMRA